MFSPLDALDTLKTCFPCFTPRVSSSTTTEATSSYDDKHTNNIRAKLGKPAKPARKVEPPIKMVATPGAAFVTEGSAAALASKRLPPLPVGEAAATTPLTMTELGEVFDQIEETLSRSGISYAICGLAAMLAHGLTKRGASTVSMVVPERSKDVILAWARAGGHTLSHSGSKASFDIQMRDGSLRGIKVRYVHGAAFDKMDIIAAPSTTGARGAKILHLASLLELIASGFQLKCEGTRPPAQDRAVEVLIEDMQIVLEGAIARRVTLRAAHLELFLSPDFWVPLQTYLGGDGSHNLVGLATKARLPIADVLEEARRRSEVRQHDEFLSTYGAAPIGGSSQVVSAQPGAFKNMKSVVPRDHANTSSVYTLGSKASHGDLGASSSQAQQQAQAGKGRLLTGSRFPTSRLGNSIDGGSGGGQGKIPVRRNSVKPPHDPHRARTSMDMVDPQKGQGRPDGWL